MTRSEFQALRPGDIIRKKSGKRTLRLVVSTERYVGLLKVGHSWTDPRPTAWYDVWVILSEYSRTGSRGCSEAYARSVRDWKKP